MDEENNYDSVQQPSDNYAGSTGSASPYAGKNSSGTPKSQGKIPDNGEVTILTRCVWKPEIDDKTEIAYLLQHKWAPSLDDFKSVTGGGATDLPANLNAMLGIIVAYQPKSIKRLNLFVHASSTAIGFDAYIDGLGMVKFYIKAEAHVAEIDAIAQAADTVYTYKGKQFTLEDVRGRFSSDAIFVLYGCKAGFDPTTLLRALHDLLNVTVIGFKSDIVFCPPRQVLSTGVFNRKGEKIGINKTDFNCGTDSTADWRSLINDPNAVKTPK